MAEDTASATVADSTTTTTTSATDEIPDLGDAGKQAIARMKAERDEARKQAKAGADAVKRLAELEESQKTEAQKLADRAAQAEKERDEARLEALRAKVGMKKKLPDDVIDLLKGDTEEELSAHADRLADHFKQSVRPSGSVDQGVRGGTQTQNPRDAFAEVIKKATG